MTQCSRKMFTHHNSELDIKVMQFVKQALPGSVPRAYDMFRAYEGMEGR
jgi:hypothetical protein